MKNLVITGLALAALFGLPTESSAKDRGCDYRLTGISQAHENLAVALRHGGNVELRRAQLRRAEIKAAEERCFVRGAAVAPRSVRRAWRASDRRFDHRGGDNLAREFRGRDHDRRHFGRRSITPRRIARRIETRIERARRIAHTRYLVLVDLGRKRHLSYAESCERDDLRKRWKF